MMKSITVKGIQQATDAAEWCKKNIHSTWNINTLDSDMFNGNYIFEFTDPIEASFFAIRWR